MIHSASTLLTEVRDRVLETVDSTKDYLSTLSTTEKVHLGMNAAIFVTATSAAFLKCVFNPVGTFLEVVPDVTVHVLEVACPNSANEIALGLNALRAAQACYAAATDLTVVPCYVFETTAPKLANLLDSGVHIFNAGYRLNNILQDAKTEQKTWGGKAVSYFWHTKQSAAGDPTTKNTTNNTNQEDPTSKPKMQ